MSFLTDLAEQIKHLPDWALVMLGLTLFGIYWKRSLWSNRYLKFVNLLLPTIIYPCIHYSRQVEYDYWNPIAVLAIHGFAIGVVSEFTHEGIVAKLKIMGMKFPEEAPHLSKTDTELLAKTETKGESKP